MKNISTFVAISLLLSACAIRPITLVEERYENLNEDREIEVIHETDYTFVALARYKKEKCEDTETVFLSKVNVEQEWKIVRLHNKRECEDEKENERVKRFKEWKQTR